MVAFFMPDGDGGHHAPSKAEDLYATVRAAANFQSFWGGTFTDRRVHSVTSHHNGRDYDQTVGEMSVRQTVHVDPSKIVKVRYFDDPPT